MAQPYSGPPFERIRKCLTDLVTSGISVDSVAVKGAALLELQIVANACCTLPDDADDEAHDVADTEALLDVLGQAASRSHIGNRRYRRVLRHVLPLYNVPGYERYRNMPLEERRTAAGENLTGNENDPAVRASTIRTYYEPRALDQLGVALIRMEAKERDEEPPPLPHVQ
jgi:hypothetical protein